jgi:NitT/TauT family transport system substrate-binding protein
VPRVVFEKGHGDRTKEETLMDGFLSIRLNLLCLLAAGFLSAISFSAVAEQPAPLSPPVRIRINTAGLLSEAGLFLAYDKGYFKAEGLDVELVTTASTNSSSDTLTQLVGADLDLGTMSLSAGLLNALNRGVGVVGLLPLNTVGPDDHSSGIVVRKDLVDSGKYQQPKNLRGMKIGVLTLGGNAHFNVLRALKAASVSESGVQITTLSFPDAVVALSNKSLDAAFEVEPFITIAKAKGAAVLEIPQGQTSPPVPTIVLFGNQSFADNHKEAVNRFVTALLRGQRDFIADSSATGPAREELIKSLQTHTQLKDAGLLARIGLPNADPNGAVNPGAVDELQKFFIASGVQQKAIDPNKLFDPQYVNYAMARLGRAR